MSLKAVYGADLVLLTSTTVLSREGFTFTDWMMGAAASPERGIGGVAHPARSRTAPAKSMNPFRPLSLSSCLFPIKTLLERVLLAPVIASPDPPCAPFYSTVGSLLAMSLC